MKHTEYSAYLGLSNAIRASAEVLFECILIDDWNRFPAAVDGQIRNGAFGAHLSSAAPFRSQSAD